MTELSWREAAPQRGFGGVWPDWEEYQTLRLCKEQFDRHGPRKDLCACGGPCNCSNAEGWWVETVTGMPVNGVYRTAVARKAWNRYGYESGIFLLGCAANGNTGVYKWLARWDGVPLLHGQMPAQGQQQAAQAPAGVNIYRQRQVNHIDLPDEVIHHGRRD